VGAKAGAVAGAALGWETGPGAVVAVVLGSLIGGAIGFFAGEKAVSGAFDLIDEKIEEAASRDYEHFKELNPDATPADYHRMQQQMDDFDTWGIP
jgi:phage tail tape-measure protein